MAAACWLGTFTSLAIIPKLHDISPLPYIYCAVNLFAYAFFLGGIDDVDLVGRSLSRANDRDRGGRFMSRLSC